MKVPSPTKVTIACAQQIACTVHSPFWSVGLCGFIHQHTHAFFAVRLARFTVKSYFHSYSPLSLSLSLSLSLFSTCVHSAPRSPRKSDWFSLFLVASFCVSLQLFYCLSILEQLQVTTTTNQQQQQQQMPLYARLLRVFCSHSLHFRVLLILAFIVFYLSDLSFE